MGIKINAGGKKKSTSKQGAAKKSTSTTKKAASKPAKKTTPAKKTAAKKTESTRPRADQKTIQAFTKKLTKAGKDRDKYLALHKDAVQECFELVEAAREANVPMSIISESSGISRQWLYKMGEHEGRSNGGTKNKAKAKKAVSNAAKKPAAKKTPAKPAAKKTAVKSGGKKKSKKK